MEYLNKILESKEINNLDKICKFVAAGSHSVLKVVTQNDLGLCSEKRIYEDHIEYSNTVFDMDFLWIANATEITFTNCIFLGKVLISQKHEGACKVYIDYCIFSQELKISGIEKSESIHLVSVNSPVISIENNISKSISLDTCRMVRLVVLDNQSEKFSTFQCKILHPSISRNVFNSVSFPYNQIDIKKQRLFRKKHQIEKDLKNFNCFYYPINDSFDELSITEKQQIDIDTLGFVLNETNIDVDKSAKAHVRYLQAIESHRTPIVKAVLWCFGGLHKPARLLLLLFSVLLMFGFIYQLPFLEFNAPGSEGVSVKRSLKFWESFYYSGITFTTVGYGDISPIGLARFVAIFEAITGVLLSSAFLVSLIRKYTE